MSTPELIQRSGRVASLTESILFFDGFCHHQAVDDIPSHKVFDIKVFDIAERLLYTKLEKYCQTTPPAKARHSWNSEGHTQGDPSSHSWGLMLAGAQGATEACQTKLYIIPN